MENTRKMLWEAANLIAVGAGPLTARLKSATEHLRHVDPDHLPPESRAPYRNTLATFSDDNAAATVSPGEAEEHAELILQLYADLHCEDGRAGA